MVPRPLAALALSTALAISMGTALSCKKRAKEWPTAMHAATTDATAASVRDAKGDVVLFVLYASWCTTCRHELPSIDEMGLRYEGKGLRVLAFALDEDPADYAEMLTEQRFHFDLVRVAPLDNAGLVAAVRGLGGSYKDSIPYVAVFDRTGKLVRDWSSASTPAEVEAAVTSAL